MSYSTISLEKREDEIAIITMNRDKEMNTLSLQMMEDIHRAMLDILGDSKIKVTIIVGKGNVFMCGAELKYLIGPEKFDLNQGRGYLLKVQSLFNLIEEFRKPVIAGINGIALGGGAELCFACDFRIMSETARLGVPEVKLGVLAGAGGVQRLPRLVGRAKAIELNMLGTHLTAEEAERCGLLYKRVPPEKLMDACLELAGELRQKSAVALAFIKECINRSMDVSIKESMKFGLEAMLRLDSEEIQEGVSAFFEKREPRFTGRSFTLESKE